MKTGWVLSLSASERRESACKWVTQFFFFKALIINANFMMAGWLLDYCCPWLSLPTPREKEQERAERQALFKWPQISQRSSLVPSISCDVGQNPPIISGLDTNGICCLEDLACVGIGRVSLSLTHQKSNFSRTLNWNHPLKHRIHAYTSP